VSDAFAIVVTLIVIGLCVALFAYMVYAKP
jgi:hypothetical protein